MGARLFRTRAIPLKRRVSVRSRFRPKRVGGPHGVPAQDTRGTVQPRARAVPGTVLCACADWYHEGMCGRTTLKTTRKQLEEAFGAPLPELKPRYNIAPSQDMLAVRAAEGGGREGLFLRWGLIPGWAKEASIGYKMINARSETVFEKPAFRSAVKRRRCLIPADGFYEWKKIGKQKQPVYIHLRDERPFAMAGLWEHWSGPDGPVESCTILTTRPNELLTDVHDRMPVILAPDSHGLWLDHSVVEREALEHLFAPYAAAEMAWHPVSTLVNSPRNQGEELIAPLPPDPQPLAFEFA